MTEKEFKEEAETLRPALQKRAYCLLGNADDADDAAQDALLKLWGMHTELRDNEGLTVILTTQKGGRNRIYMLKASGERAGKKNLIYHNISTTIIIKYR